MAGRGGDGDGGGGGGGGGGGDGCGGGGGGYKLNADAGWEEWDRRVRRILTDLPCLSSET